MTQSPVDDPPSAAAASDEEVDASAIASPLPEPLEPSLAASSTPRVVLVEALWLALPSATPRGPASPPGPVPDAPQASKPHPPSSAAAPPALARRSRIVSIVRAGRRTRNPATRRETAAASARPIHPEGSGADPLLS